MDAETPARRVVVTGAGIVCSLGASTAEFWRNALAGRTRVRPIPAEWRRYADFRSALWSPLPDLDWGALGISRNECVQLDQATRLALCATREALEHAGIEPIPTTRRGSTFTLPIAAERCGVYVGTGIGGAESFVTNYAQHMLDAPAARLARLAHSSTVGEEARNELDGVLGDLPHPPRFNPFAVSRLMPNATAASIGIKYGLRGPNCTDALACASGTAALGRAFTDIGAGVADVAIALGCEYLRDPYGGIFRGFDAAGTLTRFQGPPEGASRPFDAARSGFLFSEGAACVLVLEELGHAERRGATPIAEFTSYASSFDAHSMMSPAPDGAGIERVLLEALAGANLEPADVDYLNAHGTATESNDVVETEVIQRVFSPGLRVNSTKSLLGHTIGASGAIEALVCALGIRDGALHPSLNLDEPIVDLDFVRERTAATVDVAMSQSFAFGGHNAALVLRRVS